MAKMPEMSKRSEIEDEMLDRILSNEDQLVPSSGFAASVMERIREEAADAVKRYRTLFTHL